MPKLTYDKMNYFQRRREQREIERRCDSLLGSHMPEDGKYPEKFPQGRFLVQKYARLAAVSLELDWGDRGDVEFPEYLDYLNGPTATLPGFWDQSRQKWAGRAISRHLIISEENQRKWAPRLITALNHEVAMAITGFERDECVAMCGVCKEYHNFALDGLSLCRSFDRFMTNKTRFCYPVTPNVVREGRMIRHPLYAAALHRAAPKLSIEHQWAYGFGWTLYERSDGMRRSVPPPVGFPRHDEFVRNLRLKYLHAAYVIARFVRRRFMHHKYKPGGPGFKKAKKHFEEILAKK